MPYTAAQLRTFYSNLHMGLAPNTLNALKISGYADQNAVGGLTDAQALTAVAQTGDMDVAVAAAAYQFFTGKTPTEAGMTYLINSPANTSDLNDPYYASFNLENRYINFATNLGLFGDGAAAFGAAFGSLTFAQAVDAAYEKIIGSSLALGAGINPTLAKANITGRQFYFQGLADQNLSGASAAMKDLAVKAGMVGYIMAEAMKADIGVYAIGLNAFMNDLALDGKASFAVDLITTYSVPANAVTLAKTVTLTSGADVGSNFTTGAGNDTFAADLNAAGQQTLNGSDMLDGGAGTNTLDAVLKASVTPAGLANIQVVRVSNLDNGAGGTSPNLDLINAGGVTTIKVHDLEDPQGIQITNIQMAPSNYEIANSAANVSFQVKAAALAGTADAATITLNGVGGGTISLSSGAAGSGYETLTLNSAGPANKIATLTDGASDKLSTITITGSADLTFTSNITDGVTKIDAKAMTGKLAIGFSNGQAVSITGGTGDDTFTFAGADYVGGASGAARDTIDGGAGLDTLAISAAAAISQTTAQANLSGIERLQLTTNLSASFDTTAFFGGMSEIVLGAAASASATLTIDSGDTVSFLTSTAGPTISVGGFGLADTARVKLGAGVTLGPVTLSGVEMVTIEVDAAGNDFSDITVTPTAASSTLRIVGSGLVMVSGPVSADVIDASGLTGSGRLVMNTAGTTRVAITGSVNDDQLTGGALADLIIGGAGADILTGGGGFDSLVLAGGGADTVSLYQIINGLDRDRVTGFSAGAGAEADRVAIGVNETTAPTAAAATIALQEITAAPSGAVAFTTAANDLLELAFNLSGANGANDLDNGTDGTALLAALGQSITVGAGDSGYILAYQGGSAYLFHATDGNANNALVATEIQLVGVFEGIAAGAFEASNFQLMP